MPFGETWKCRFESRAFCFSESCAGQVITLSVYPALGLPTLTARGLLLWQEHAHTRLCPDLPVAALCHLAPGVCTQEKGWAGLASWAELLEHRFGNELGFQQARPLGPANSVLCGERHDWTRATGVPSKAAVANLSNFMDHQWSADRRLATAALKHGGPGQGPPCLGLRTAVGVSKQEVQQEGRDVASRWSLVGECGVSSHSSYV